MKRPRHCNSSGNARLATDRRLAYESDEGPLTLGQVAADILALRSILGDELLGTMVEPHAVSAESIETLSRASAGRIKMIGRIVWCLRGTYPDDGIKRWFRRCRPQLAGRSPTEHLGDDWLPDSSVALQVLALAEKLL